MPKCTTYGSPQLSGHAEFEVVLMEVWAVGPVKKRLGSVEGEEVCVRKYFFVKNVQLCRY